MVRSCGRLSGFVSEGSKIYTLTACIVVAGLPLTVALWTLAHGGVCRALVGWGRVAVWLRGRLDDGSGVAGGHRPQVMAGASRREAPQRRLEKVGSGWLAGGVQRTAVQLRPCR